MEDKTIGGGLDLHNCITGEELRKLLRRQLEVLGQRPELAHALPPLMVWGAPGLGKSSILKDVAREAGIGFIDVRLAQREPVDIRGLPVPGEDGVKWLVASEWPRDPSSRGIILFDEITAADRSLQVAAYEFILDRRLGELYTVPDGWYICAAGNRTEDRAVATTMSSALANRFLHVEMRDDAESWVRWALGHDIAPAVVGFIRFRPALLFSQKDENLERGWPSPRSWERVSHMLGALGTGDRALLPKVVDGLVGRRAGLEFMAFLEVEEDMADVLELMLDASRPVDPPEKTDRLYAFCSALVYNLWRGRTDEDEARRMDGFYRISAALPRDFAAMSMLDAMSGNAGHPMAECARKLYRHPRYAEWAARNGQGFARRMGERK